MSAILLVTGCVSARPPFGHPNVLKQGSGVVPSTSSIEPLRGTSRLRRHHTERSLDTQAARSTRAQVAEQAAIHGTAEADAFERLLVLAGLDPWDELPLRASALTPTQAARMLSVLLKKPVTLGNLPPRMGASLLLREVLAGDAASREDLLRRMTRLERLAVLRPDGYLAWVINGRTQQRVGQVEWKDGAFVALGFELGRFYVNTGGVFRPTDEQLHPVFNGFVVEVYDDADILGRSLDGAEDAFFELAMSIGRFFTSPTDSLLSLQHLPEGIAALVASSPEYLERFSSMTRGEQVRAVAKLLTTLYAGGGVVKGSTGALTSVMGGAGTLLPVLSLTGEGALVMERVAVPVGRMAYAVGTGVGGLYVLASADPGGGGSGLKVAPPERVVNDLKDFSGKRFQAGSETFLLDKKGLQHILERHHPRYWNGTTKAAQSFFGAKMNFEDVIRSIEAVLQQNRERMVGRGTRGMYQLTGVVDGVEYILGLNQGRVGQFYPR
ncbi:hypothetical protein [Corallococcus silvisoli]|uniref:hypothetical protein n=1 Tax=Corallococcus silvisoli TaxID=2697031 RepID=UPI001378DF89|nr:hypothetical protein [Corallococcus silvisoli]NBD09735.1 hypothetical protein [Corallococcus silvisoli]